MFSVAPFLAVLFFPLLASVLTAIECRELLTNRMRYTLHGRYHIPYWSGILVQQLLSSSMAALFDHNAALEH